MAYEIIIKPSAQRDLDGLPIHEAQKIASRIVQLSNHPRPFGVQKLRGDESYRIRSGNYRVLFEIDDKAERVNVYRVKHRKDVYR